MPRVIPFGNRILVRRRKVGDKAGKDSLIHLPESTSEKAIDLADVIFVPEHSFCDKTLLENSETIIESLTDKAKNGDSEALKALLEYNVYLKIKSIQPGDAIMVSKYVGVDFHDSQNMEQQTLINGEDVIGLVIDG